MPKTPDGGWDLDEDGGQTIAPRPPVKKPARPKAGDEPTKNEEGGGLRAP